MDVFLGIEETLDDYCRHCTFTETSICIRIKCPILHKLTSYGKILDPKGFEVARKTPKKYVNRPWSDEEVEMLKKYVDTRTVREIAELLNRPQSSVRNRINRQRAKGEL